MSPIAPPVLPLALPEAIGERPGLALEAGQEPGFGAVLENALVRANDQIQAASAQAQAFAAGTHDDIHGTMIGLSEAGIQLRLVGSMRNKVVDAFYELWRMQV